MIAIYNIYNPPPESYNSQKSKIFKTLYKIIDNLIIKHEHVVLGDFNLYYPL
jgi:hypothetical protein